MGTPRRISWAAVFVYAVWAVTTAGCCWLVARYGRNCPWADEWVLVPWLCGRGRVDAQWIFDLHNEHRIPLVRLVLFGLYRVCSLNFFAGDWLNVMALSASSLLLVVAARRYRGRLSWTDAIFPALLLSWSQWENMLNGWQAQYTLAILLASLYLWLTFRPGHVGWRVAPAALALIGVAACGANGVLLAAVLSLSLPWISGKEWRSSAFIGVVAVVAAVVALRPGPSGGDAEPDDRSPVGLARNAAGFFGASVGPAFAPVPNRARLPGVLSSAELGDVAIVWPISAVLGIAAAALGAFAVLRGAHPTTACFWLSGMAMLAVLAWTRRVGWEVLDRPETLRMLTTRYALLLSPIPLGAYLACESRNWPRAQAFIACIVLGGAVASFPAASWAAARRSAEIDAFLADARRVDSTEAAEIHFSRMALRDPAPLGDSMRLLRDHGHPSFVCVPAGNR